MGRNCIVSLLSGMRRVRRNLEKDTDSCGVDGDVNGSATAPRGSDG